MNIFLRRASLKSILIRIIPGVWINAVQRTLQSRDYVLFAEHKRLLNFDSNFLTRKKFSSVPPVTIRWCFQLDRAVLTSCLSILFWQGKSSTSFRSMCRGRAWPQTVQHHQALCELCSDKVTVSHTWHGRMKSGQSEWVIFLWEKKNINFTPCSSPCCVWGTERVEGDGMGLNWIGWEVEMCNVRINRSCWLSQIFFVKMM